MLVTPTVLRVKTGLQPRKGRIIQAQSATTYELIYLHEEFHCGVF